MATPTAPPATVFDKLAELERNSPQHPVTRESLFAFLDELSAIDAARLLASEHPQTIALVVTALVPDQAASILHSLPESLRWDVTQRLTRIRKAAPDVLREVAASLQSRLQMRHPHQQRPVTEDSATENRPGWPFTFEDLSALDIRSLATVMGAIEAQACAVALLDRSEAFKQGLLRKMAKPVSSSIRHHLKHLGPVRLLEITASQDTIASTAWNLAQQGMIVLPEYLENAA